MKTSMAVTGGSSPRDEMDAAAPPGLRRQFAALLCGDAPRAVGDRPAGRAERLDFLELRVVSGSLTGLSLQAHRLGDRLALRLQPGACRLPPCGQHQAVEASLSRTLGLAVTISVVHAVRC